MSNPDPAFSPAEYADRLARVRRSMDTAGLDTLFITDPSNMAWLTGYDGWSFYVHQGVIVGPEGDPHWWGRGMDAAGALRTVYMADDHVHGYEDHLVQNPQAHPMTDLAQVLSDLGLTKGRIGVEMDNYYFSAKACDTLRDAGLAPMDATGLVNWCRLLKSRAEQDFMRRAGAIVTRMHSVIAEMAEAGMPKNRLVAEITKVGIEGVEGAWGDYPAIVPITPSGMDATAAHLTWDDSPLPRDTPTFFEIAGVYRRYQCPQSRTLFIGKVPDKYARAAEAVQAATDAVTDIAAPGTLAEELAAAFNGTLAKHGFTKDSRCGYPIGLSYPPDWGERTMSLRAGDKTVLEPGMTFHFMPALWLDDGGIETTEPLLITDTGCEKLAQTPPGLVVKD
ncbi:MAG: M24 family metallopeptidase [Paracoccaceae bacterium]